MLTLYHLRLKIQETHVKELKALDFAKIDAFKEIYDVAKDVFVQLVYTSDPKCVFYSNHVLITSVHGPGLKGSTDGFKFAFGFPIIIYFISFHFNLNLQCCSRAYRSRRRGGPGRRSSQTSVLQILRFT